MAKLQQVHYIGKKGKSWGNLSHEHKCKHLKTLPNQIQQHKKGIMYQAKFDLFYKNNKSSVQLSVVYNSLRPHGMQQHVRLPSPSPTPGACSNSCPQSQGCHPTISSSVISFFLPSIFPGIRRVSSSHQVAKVLEFQLQHQSFQ